MRYDPSVHDKPGLPPRHTEEGDDGVPVHPRIQTIERRMQLRTPEQQRGEEGNAPSSDNPDTTTTTTTMMLTATIISNNYPPTTANHTEFEHRNKENTNHAALVLHSPILASIYNSNIKQFEADVLKRQAEYTNRISDIEGRLAIFHSRLAVECAERGREQAFTVEEYIDGPLAQVMCRSLERITTDFVVPIMDPRYATDNSRIIGSCEQEQPTTWLAEDEERDDGERIIGETHDENDATDYTTATDAATATTPARPNLVSVERRTNHLEDQMNHFKHITLVQARRNSFDDIDKACRQTLQPALVLEMTKANKREGGVVRRFESNAGEHTRLFAEMTASRAASLGYIKNEVDGWETIDSTFAENYLEEIERLKQRVLELREERMRQDDKVVEKIMQDKTALEEVLFSVCS